MMVNTTEIDVLANNYLAQHIIDQIRQDYGKNFQTEVYLDSIDVQSMISGVAGDINDNFRQSEFSYQYSIGEEDVSYQMLVHAMAYLGWIDNLKISASHIMEVQQYINSSYHLQNISKEECSSAVEEAFGILEFKELKDYFRKQANLKSHVSDEKRLKSSLERIREKSKDIFILNYFLKRIHWRLRYEYLFGRQGRSLLSIDNKEEDYYIKILNAPEFQKLEKFFLKERPLKSRNNFNDSFALTEIIFKAREFEKHFNSTNSKGSKLRLPLFFASTGLMFKILRTKGLRNLFDINLGKRYGTISVLQISQFFVLDVLFDRIRSVDEEKVDEFFHSVKVLKQLRIDGELSFTNAAKSIIADITNKANDLIKHIFFEKIWFEHNAKKEVEGIIKDYVNFEQWSENKLLTNSRVSITRYTDKNILDGIQKLDWINKTISSTERFNRYVKENLKLDRYGESSNPFLEFGITRFSFKSYNSVYRLVNKLVIDLTDLNSLEGQSSFHRDRVELIRHLVNGIFRYKYEELEIALSVMWVFGEYRFITKALDKVFGKRKDYGEQYSLAILHASSIDPSYPEREHDILRIIKCIEKKDIARSNYKVCIGLGYVYYHLWKSQDVINVFPEFPSDIQANNEVQEKREKYYYYIQKSLEYNQKALKWLEKNKDKKIQAPNSDIIQKIRNIKFYYAVNNYLFYITRGGTAEEFRNSLNYYTRLRNAPDSYRQPRFEDTLTLYYMRMSILVPETKQEWLDKAEESSREALRISVMDRDELKARKEQLLVLRSLD